MRGARVADGQESTIVGEEGGFVGGGSEGKVFPELEKQARVVPTVH